MDEKAHLMIEGLNLMGYDAIGIGDDDLTLGKEFLLEISKKANFPFLSSNFFDEASGKISSSFLSLSKSMVSALVSLAFSHLTYSRILQILGERG